MSEAKRTRDAQYCVHRQMCVAEAACQNRFLSQDSQLVAMLVVVVAIMTMCLC